MALVRGDRGDPVPPDEGVHVANRVDAVLDIKRADRFRVAAIDRVAVGRHDLADRVLVLKLLQPFFNRLVRARHIVFSPGYFRT